MKSLSATKLYALAFGLFLGLCIWKFGNPVILDQKISAPVSLSDFLNEPWPTHWANWIFLPLAAIGAILIFQEKISWPRMKWLWLLPLAWLGWQFVSATQTVDADLTATTLWQYAGCVACYFVGVLIFARNNLWRWLLPGLLAAFTFCLVCGIDQRAFEFPQNRQMLVEGQRSGWTNFPPATVVEMKNENVIITTNGLDMANPVILDKLKKGRVYGTLVYPNALAGLILLLWPASLALVFGATKKLKPFIRLAAIAMSLFLGSAAFYWSGSKLGWLIAIGIVGIFLLRLDWPKKLKLAALATVLILGLGTFTFRFHHYFAAGATSVSARLDYWHAAVQTTAAKPVFGTGPGTFQRPYSKIREEMAAQNPKLKLPEMARLAHNDYLEQFSDSGIPGGIFYASWIFLALATIARCVWKSGGQITFAIFAGLLGCFVQGIGEFGLYIPALAWTVFTLMGCLIGREINQFDKKSGAR